MEHEHPPTPSGGAWGELGGASTAGAIAGSSGCRGAMAAPVRGACAAALVLSWARLAAPSVCASSAWSASTSSPASTPGSCACSVRAPSALRIEETESRRREGRAGHPRAHPRRRAQTINDNIGVPTFYNLAFIPSDNVGGQDAEILMALKPATIPPSGSGSRLLREELARRFPEALLLLHARRPGDAGAQLRRAAAIDVQVAGPDAAGGVPGGRAPRSTAVRRDSRQPRTCASPRWSTTRPCASAVDRPPRAAGPRVHRA